MGNMKKEERKEEEREEETKKGEGRECEKHRCRWRVMEEIEIEGEIEGYGISKENERRKGERKRREGIQERKRN